MDEYAITVDPIDKDGFVLCPRCYQYHRLLLNPSAIYTKKLYSKEGKMIGTETTSSPICDRCCHPLLEAFTDPNWEKFWPNITTEEAKLIINTIKKSFKLQRKIYSGK